MKHDRLTMREAILYRLIKNLEQGNEYIPVFDFMGDIYAPELKKGGFVSHECSARLSEINKENPSLLDIVKRRSQYSPNRYNCYRLHFDFSVAHIADNDLRQFVNSLTFTPPPKPPPQHCPHGVPTFAVCTNCPRGNM